VNARLSNQTEKRKLTELSTFTHNFLSKNYNIPSLHSHFTR